MTTRSPTPPDAAREDFNRYLVVRGHIPLTVAQLLAWEDFERARTPTTGASGEDGEALRDALAPLALLGDPEGARVNMSDPLSKWFTFAQLRQAHFALAPQPGAAQAGGEIAEVFERAQKQQRTSIIEELTAIQQALYAALKSLVEACERADAQEELPEEIDGSLIDGANDALRLLSTLPDAAGDRGGDAARSAATPSPAEVDACAWRIIRLHSPELIRSDLLPGVWEEMQRIAKAALAKPDAQASEAPEPPKMQRVTTGVKFPFVPVAGQASEGDE